VNTNILTPKIGVLNLYISVNIKNRNLFLMSVCPFVAGQRWGFLLGPLIGGGPTMR
jgi:hypothetical protein